MANITVHTADTRGHVNHGWLNAKHSFSFASFYNPERVQFGALRVLNDDIIAPGMGFGKHPHDNMEIVTIVLDGALEHKDSMGHGEVLRPNEVQAMSAGTGIFHSEYNHNKDKPINLLQTWIFPNKKNVEPQYAQTVFKEEERENKWQMLVSPVGSNDAGLKIHQDAWIYRTKLSEGQSLTHQLNKKENGIYLFVIEGGIKVEDKTLGKRDAAGITDVESVNITATADSDILMFEVPMNY